VKNIKMDLREEEWGGMDRLDLAQDRNQRRALANTVIEPSGCIKCKEVLE
jgi:hypothetical protein